MLDGTKCELIHPGGMQGAGAGRRSHPKERTEQQENREDWGESLNPSLWHRAAPPGDAAGLVLCLLLLGIQG